MSKRFYWHFVAYNSILFKGAWSFRVMGSPLEFMDAEN